MAVIDQVVTRGSRTLSAEKLDGIATLDVLGLADRHLRCDVAPVPNENIVIRRRPAYRGSSRLFSRRTMICIDCATQGMSEPAVGVCVHCGAATCLVHVAIQTLAASAPGVVAPRQARRMITCAHCGEPRTTPTRARHKATATDR